MAKNTEVFNCVCCLAAATHFGYLPNGDEVRRVSTVLPSTIERGNRCICTRCSEAFSTEILTLLQHLLYVFRASLLAPRTIILPEEERR